MTILAIISYAQLALPVTPWLVVFRKRPLEVIEKFSGFHSLINIAVAVGVVVTGNNPTLGSRMRGADDFASQYGCPPRIARFFQVSDDSGTIIRMAESSHVFSDEPRWALFLDSSVELVLDTAWGGGVAGVTGFPLSPALEDVNSSKVTPPEFHHVLGSAIHLPTRLVPPHV
jgi:hypothetical protein